MALRGGVSLWEEEQRATLLPIVQWRLLSGLYLPPESNSRSLLGGRGAALPQRA